MAAPPDGAKILRVHAYPAEVLRRLAHPVDARQLDEELSRFVASMIRTMYEAAGVGLAAPQVGASIRLIVVDPTQERNSPLVMVNPVIVDAAGKELAEEGCLSVPGIRAKVRRHDRLTVEYDTLEGEKTGIEAEGLLARIVQHEVDHLDGALFIDRLGPAGRFAVRMALRELEDAAREGP